VKSKIVVERKKKLFRTRKIDEKGETKFENWLPNKKQFVKKTENKKQETYF